MMTIQEILPCFLIHNTELNITHIPYFFDYKTVLFSFQINPKNLDLPYKMDLDLWDYLARVKLVQS